MEAAQALFPRVEIVSRAKAIQRLMSPSRRGEVGCLVSIGAPDQRPPRGFLGVERRLRLLFHDVERDEGAFLAPSDEDVARLIQLAHELVGSTCLVLVHCEAGISRSTASALTLFAVWLGPGYEEEAVARVFQLVPEAWPNETLVRLADTRLGREGRLVAAVEQRIAARGGGCRP
ncbi:Predicted protein tyrosine phosphatase [Myxococcus fulvus]|uniref:Protein-tyrosine-phosphatase n=1 Tax=Myxococcus fulvus TaxID=33 RepID=A0A511TJX6_MYXFU|nr:hypothetical protein [Myxococcus fulvus]AKF87341.1 hypothetical protein MFUL124B02_41550 [Myxococcus fulvus 124B02]GEN13518.1 protein-tyrosine-phosphatase [Myxococcus fulvus]SEU37191.1 Predicted protein tyrosine phosphatase [Myxococcus fulvus]